MEKVTFNTYNLKPITIKISVDNLKIIHEVLTTITPFVSLDRSSNVLFNSIFKEVYIKVAKKVLSQTKNIKLKPYEALILSKALMLQLKRLDVYEANLATMLVHEIDRFYI